MADFGFHPIPVYCVECENYIFRTRMGCSPFLKRKTKFSHSFLFESHNKTRSPPFGS